MHGSGKGLMQLLLDVESVSPNAVMEVLVMGAVLMRQGDHSGCHDNEWVMMLYLNFLSFCVTSNRFCTRLQLNNFVDWAQF